MNCSYLNISQLTILSLYGAASVFLQEDRGIGMGL